MMITDIVISPNYKLRVKVEASSKKEAIKIIHEILEAEERKEEARWQKLIRDYGGR